MSDDTARLSAFSPGEQVPAARTHDSAGVPCDRTLKSRTELGRRLREIRRRIVAAGEPLLGWDEFDREMQERRGEHEPEA